MKLQRLYPAVFICLSIIFYSCSADFDEPENSNSKVGFNEASNSANKLMVTAGSGSQTIFGPVINLNSSSTATSEIHVQLAIDNSIVTAYNTANGTNYIVPASNMFSISGLTVTIPPGQSSGKLAIVIPDPSLLGFNNTYALGFKIVSVDGGYKIDESLKSVPVLINLINQYDGVYNLKSKFTLLSSGVSSSTGPVEVSLMTVGPYSLKMTAAHPYSNLATALPAYAAPTYTVDPSTNFVSVDAVVGAFNGIINNTAVSRYSPGARTFYLGFSWNNALAHTIKDTMVWVRNRP